MSVLDLDFNFTSDGSSKVCNVPLSAKYMFFATGAFGGGTLCLEASPDDGVNWFTVDVLPEAGRIIRYLVSGEKVRITLVDSTSPDIDTGIRQ